MSFFTVTHPVQVPHTTTIIATTPAAKLHKTPSPPSIARPSSVLHLKALELPEILSLIGRFLSQRDALSCVLVSRAWHEAFQPVLWGHVETANDIPPEDMVSHAHYIRSLSLADLTGLDTVLDKCTRLETLILWPDAFENEEDEEDEEDEEEESDGEEEEIQMEEMLFGVKDKAQVGDMKNGGREIVLQGNSNSTVLESQCKSSNDEGEIRLLDHMPQTSPIHPMDQLELHERFSGQNLISGNKNDGSTTGINERERFRRDSGFNETSNQDSSASTTMDMSIALLGMKDAMRIQSPKETEGFHRHHHQKLKKKPQSQLTKLILRNRNLTRVEVYVDRKSPGGSFWRALAASSTSSWCPCPRLSAFQSLVNLQVYKHIKPFLQMCTRLESLDLEQCSLRQLEDSSYYTSLNFSRMKELRFGRIKGTSLQAQLLIMRQCPELRSLDWRVPRLGLPVQEFCEGLRESWPKLESLVLPESRLTDSELAQVLKCSGVVEPTARTRVRQSKAKIMDSRQFLVPDDNLNRMYNGYSGHNTKGLTRFEARRSDFANESFLALKEHGHFDTLRNLDLYQCRGLTSWMIAEILNNCPLLDSFDGYQLFARDIVSFNSDNGNGSSNDDDGYNGTWWACRRIRYLDIHITGFSSDPIQDLQRQWQTFAQLARLEHLVYLSIGGENSRTSSSVADAAESSMSASEGTTASSLSSSYATLNRSYGGIGNGGLDLRLRSGLGQLRTLKKLRMLRFTGLEQRMTEQDVLWMIENLPELKIIQGKLHINQVEQEKLEKLLERNNISAWTTYNQPYGAGHKRRQ
ncbi:hypothetical protein BGZ49_007229 [Haplosporangium sp. Z 27]|nr:hypothetical protein BGZ49_007229 [Haplosporangium sp. Z 27]